MRGNLITVSAPSGAGKTSLVDALVKTDDTLRVSVSHTTRPTRPGEKEGVNYHFVDQSTFDTMVTDSAFLEHATVFGNSYGTSKQWVSDTLDQGYDVILEIDWQGAAQVRGWLDSIGISDFGYSIFILPPSRDELHRRLTGRGQDDEATIARRMDEAVAEMSQHGQADYIVINDDFDQALAQLQTIVTAARLRQPVQQLKYAKLLEQLT